MRCAFRIAGTLWSFDASAIALRLGAPSANVPDGDVDDVAMWNRVLDLEEMADVYRAGSSIKDACGL